MTDHIIKAAQEAGFTLQRDERLFREMLERFYAIAFKAGMERAAEICEAKHAIRARDGFPREASTARALATAIRAHAQNQPKNVHDTGNVSKN
jgi:hypothetical protein